MTRAEYRIARRLGKPAEGNISGVIRGGYIYRGEFYTVIGITRVKYPASHVAELRELPGVAR